MVARKTVQAQTFKQTLQNKPVGREEAFSQTFLIKDVGYFSEPTFCGSFRKPWKVTVVDNVLSSNEQEIYPTTTVVENCIEFEFQTRRIFHVDLRQTYMALQLKFVRGRGYDCEAYFTKKSKQSAQTLNTRELCTARGTTLKNFSLKLRKHLCRKLSSQGEWKCLAEAMASCCMINWGWLFASFSIAISKYENLP